MKPRRRYKNSAEEWFCLFAEEKGYIPIKRGWPDFFCYDKKTKRIMCVEVKPNKKHPLKKEQKMVCGMLSEHNIPVYRWDMEQRFLQRLDKHGNNIISKVTNRQTQTP